MAEQTDDQRAAADVMTELHECAEGANPYGGMAARALALIQNRDDELARLRAELAETRGELDSFAQLQREYAELINRLVPAGDALADAAAGTSNWRGLPSALWAPLADARDAWRSVRGDAPAPAEPPADPTRTSPASTGVGWVLTDPDVALPIHAWSPGLIRDELAAKLGIPGDDITVDCVAGQLRTPTVQVTLRMAELIADEAARGGYR